MRSVFFSFFAPREMGEDGLGKGALKEIISQTD